MIGMKKGPNRLIARCTSAGKKTHIVSQYATYPVRFVQLDNELDCSHVYMLGYGGGLVGGDINVVHMKVEDNAKLCLRTQGSTKVYKSLEASKSTGNSNDSSSSTSINGDCQQIMECSIHANAMVKKMLECFISYTQSPLYNLIFFELLCF